jgi:hypothetical protein
MITFYNDCSIYGGTEQLTVTLAREMYRLNIPFKAVLPKAGKQWEMLAPWMLPEWMHDFEKLNVNHPQPFIDDDDVVLVHCAAQAARLRGINPRILYWCVSSDMIKKKKNPLVGLLAVPVEWLFIRHLLRTESLWFIDDTSVRCIGRRLGIPIKTPLYLPVPAAADTQNRYSKSAGSSGGGLILTYLGRAEDWKVYPCAEFLKRIKKSVVVKEVHVVTNSAERFRAYLKEQGADSGSVIYHEGLYGEALREFLLATSDLHFAMGTSALDAAGLGIPTVVVDPFSDPTMAVHAEYRWVYEIKNYTLGEFLTPHNRTVPGRPLEQMLNEFKQDRAVISERCRTYVLQQHDPAVVCNRLVDAATRSRTRLRCLRWFDGMVRLRAWLPSLAKQGSAA